MPRPCSSARSPRVPRSASVTSEHGPMSDSGAKQRGRIEPSTPAAIAEAAALLRAGDIVGMPTETVYGLAADALDPAAVKKIFAAKGRPVDHPLIVHLPSAEHLAQWAAAIPKDAIAL